MKKKFFKRKYLWASLACLLIAGGDGFVLLKSFVLPEAGVSVAEAEAAAATTTADTTSTSSTTTDSSTDSSSSSEATITDTSYSDDNIQIAITEEVVDNTTVYVVDIQVSDASYLQTALAQGTYGRNITETTSAIAEDNDAILAINGDYYGFRSTGYVIRNGVLYRDTAGDSDQEDLVIDSDGSFSIVNESETSAADLLAAGAQQVLSFGPTLIEDSTIAVSESSEVGQSMQSNPRTAIGQISENHYVIVVSEGRTDDSEGLSLYQLAEVFEGLGATTAYNLDGGGSTTLYFNGEVVNQTVGGSGGSSERAVSDILYFGY